MSADLSAAAAARDRLDVLLARPSTPGAGEAIDAPALVAACVPHIQQAIAFVCRRRRLSPDDAHDLASDVYVRLLQHDAAVLRRYRGESSLATFLVVVIERVLLDARIARAGKWRPSAVARRLGRVAIHLERLVFHEGSSLAEAGALVREHTGATHTDDELHFLLALLPPRCRRRMVGDRELEHVPAATADTEDRYLPAEGDAAAKRRAAARALARLSADDRRLIGLRFSRGWRLCEIARADGIDEKRIYRRFERALTTLRAECGVSARPPGPRRRWSRAADRS
jgi:RNA polymerase sigma factor (sigma-70 family)